MANREDLNNGNPNRMDAVFNNVEMGELLTLLIKGATPTETGLGPSSRVVTLAATPTAVFQVNATAGGTTGIKKVLTGTIADANPAAGECVWEPGTKKIKLSAADGAISAVSVTYAVATDKASCLMRSAENL